MYVYCLVIPDIMLKMFKCVEYYSEMFQQNIQNQNYMFVLRGSVVDMVIRTKEKHV